MRYKRKSIVFSVSRGKLQGLTVDALAPSAEEGRGSLRKVSGSREQASIREYPNGETRQRGPLASSAESIGGVKGTRGTETSKYPEEKRVFPE
jgi:hypothetical protein